jgi:hypothetical protein
MSAGNTGTGSNDDTPQRQQGKRKRTSCSDCHKRKLKCDREYPACGRCRKRGVPCYYDEWSTLTVDAPPRAVQARIRKMTPPKPMSSAPSTHRPLYGPLTGQPQKDGRIATGLTTQSLYSAPYQEVVEQQPWQVRRESDFEKPVQRQRPGEYPIGLAPGTLRAEFRKQEELAAVRTKPGRAFETQFNGPTNPYNSLVTVSPFLIQPSALR